MEIVQIVGLVLGILFLIGGGALCVPSDSKEVIGGFLFGVFGIFLFLTSLFAGSKLPKAEINQSELTNMKITMTIINSTDTICDTTYVYEPKR